MSAVMKSASSSSPSVQYLNGRCEKSTFAIVSVMMLVPKRSLWRQRANSNINHARNGAVGHCIERLAAGAI